MTGVAGPSFLWMTVKPLSATEKDLTTAAQSSDIVVLAQPTVTEGWITDQLLLLKVISKCLIH